MPISGRTYIVIGAAVGFFVFLLTQVFGRDILAWFLTLQRDASGFGALTTLIVEPFIQMFRNTVYGAIAAGLLWPFLFIWLFFLLLLVLVVFGSGAIQDVQREISMITTLM